MIKGPKTPEETGLIVSGFLRRGIEVIISGHWAIEAFEAEEPIDEIRIWLKRHPPEGPLDLSCRFDNQAIIESVLATLGFTFCGDFYRGPSFENEHGEVVTLHFFRPARDGGRIYPKLGLNGEDWYYSPRTVTNGRLGSVRVFTEGPLAADEQRAALPIDEA